MKIENCLKLKLLKFLKLLKAVELFKVLLTVLVAIFPDVIFRFAVYCFANIVNIVRVSLTEKLKDSNLKESIDFRVRTE